MKSKTIDIGAIPIRIALGGLVCMQFSFPEQKKMHERARQSSLKPIWRQCRLWGAVGVSKLFER
jgi:hypothetical protein